jgi:hypothetical protein
MLLSLLLTLAVSQMGFDQDKTVHHFHLYKDGGAIEVRAKDEKNGKETKAQVRVHLSHIATMFGNGDFDAPMLVHGTKDVPGIGVLASRRDAVTYRAVETPAGGRVDIVTTDPAALAALHEFLRYQIREHKTGDAVTVTPRR